MKNSICLTKSFFLVIIFLLITLMPGCKKKEEKSLINPWNIIQLIGLMNPNSTITADVYEPDNDIAHATPLVIDAIEQSHSFLNCNPEEVDFYSIDITDTKKLYTISATPANPKHLINLSLYDTDGITLIHTIVYNEILNFRFSKTGIYYLEANGTSCSGANYTMKIATSGTLTCRSAATVVTADLTGAGGASGVGYTCSYNTSINRYDCALTSSPTNYRLQISYSTEKDFIDDRALGSFLYTSSTIEQSFGYTLTKDSAGKVTAINGGGLGGGFVTTVTAWDANNRPTTGTASYQNGVCTNIPVSISYDSTARTIMFTFDTSAGTNGTGVCSSNITKDILTFDVNGNLTKFWSDYAYNPVTGTPSAFAKQYVYVINTTQDYCY